MFPPPHLPRSGGDCLSSTEHPLPLLPPDPVLDILSPLLSGTSSGAQAEAGPSRWTVPQVRQVREKLESAVQLNKVGSLLP